VPPDDAVHEIRRFLLRCRTWATERELPARRARLQHSDAPEEAAKLHGWLTYVQFLDHTLAELDEGTLDHWFEAPPPPSEPQDASDGGAPSSGPV